MKQLLPGSGETLICMMKFKDCKYKKLFVKLHLGEFNEFSQWTNDLILSKIIQQKESVLLF